MLRRWWDKYPERLAHELQALRDVGIEYNRNEAAFSEGVLELNLTVSIDNKRLELVARFPEVYPYTRFEVYAPDLNLPHHQNPFHKNLCLFERDTINWSVSDTLASAITRQLPKVIHAALNPNIEELKEIEVPQAEPVSAYYGYQPGAAILVDGTWSLDRNIKGGSLLLGVMGKRQPLFHGAVLEIRDSNGTVIAKFPPEIAKTFSHHLLGRWIRCDAPVLQYEPNQMLAELQKRQMIGSPTWCGAGEGQIDVLGLVFPEETSHRQEGQGWVFLVRFREKKGATTRITPYLARAERAGRTDLASRIPELAGLGRHKIAVFGVGCVGAPSVMEFARAGIGDLRILDCDTVDAGGVVRWPIGLSASGWNKVDALGAYLSANYPYTNLHCFNHRLGSVKQPQSDLDVIEKMLNGIDLVYDATAEVGLQHLLSDLAHERRVPYVSISTTNGGWGGRVLRLRPDAAGCWICVQMGMEDGTIPIPPAKEDWIQPVGCNDRTFTAAGFDVLEVSLMGVRLAIATLCSASGYPDYSWDIGVLRLRNDRREVIAPSWQTFPLICHDKCPACHPPRQ